MFTTSEIYLVVCVISLAAALIFLLQHFIRRKQLKTKQKNKDSHADHVQIPVGELHTILVIEDDTFLSEFICKNLTQEGYKCINVNSGNEALKLLNKHHVDILICDITTPSKGGVDFCKKIKHDINYNHLPFILLTGKTSPNIEIDALENGAYACIAKPFKWKQLSLTIKNLIQLHHSIWIKFSQHPFEDTESLYSAHKDRVFLKKIISAVEEHISDTDFSVEGLSKKVGLSRSALYKKIKTITGHVPSEFIRQVRLKHAARLLITREYNISEIGYMVGFSSPSYFSRCFYQQFQVTPTEFLKYNSKN
ncbi:response regulator transcription factor [Desertivirga xinjiangensis]|uniref:response regulator transcription factor n=1 Tax=Desertivirga xinjiangensis TaxID=539206 RepID=UPI00210A2978|nr:response regulator transcription factor [Pedobacter xinjiangensis]